mmetsp:Transcript_39924/g.60352  ORF Transcript_39924/g.60352 Transcript_39924/m.60352 type:complete len:81 (-) Transcript_39924:513-755(-)
MVLMAPTKNAVRSVPVSEITRFKSESNRRSGTARGTRNLFTILYMGDEKGMIPILATVSASVIVASGAKSSTPLQGNPKY